MLLLKKTKKKNKTSTKKIRQYHQECAVVVVFLLSTFFFSFLLLLSFISLRLTFALDFIQPNYECTLYTAYLLFSSRVPCDRLGCRITYSTNCEQDIHFSFSFMSFLLSLSLLSYNACIASSGMGTKMATIKLQLSVVSAAPAECGATRLFLPTTDSTRRCAI